MFKHLLVPLDGSKLAEAVLSPTQVLATGSGARVTLFHVVEKNPPAQVHGEPHLTGVREAAEYLGAVAARLGAQGIQVDLHVHDEPHGDVALSITEHAAEYGADLIVLATHGSGGMREIVFGTIAQKVIGYGPTPVLVIHPDTAPTVFDVTRLAIPWDGKPSHESALPIARELAKSLGARAHFVSVVPRRTDLGGTAAGAVGKLLPTATALLLEAREQEATQQMAALAAQWELEGVPATYRVERGDPAAMILHALKESKADLLVLSTHTKKGWSAFWAGSVAPRVMSQWRRATLLVRANPL
ncbi:MAG TPA: universal stress protein [Symbiobacteriaceae bacterium]|jgi:nucleotide-binding universal stress UspA family protein